MTFTLYDENLNKIDYPVGITPLDFLVSSIERERYEESVLGIPGSIDYGFDFKEREITLNFQMEHYHDTYDFRLLRDALYNIFSSNNHLYVLDNLLPTRLIKFQVDGQFRPERYGYWYSTVEISGKTTGLPFWRTIYTTQDIEKNGYSALVEKFGMADGVHLDYLTYTPKTNTFSIWNGGNVTIDPRHFDLSIRLLYATAKGNVTIENLTTGEKFIFYRQFENTHLNIFGSQVLLGNTNWLRESNRKFISLVPGENKIKVSNVEHQGVSFDFPYYFK
ncbi:phage tail domain-containing protein [Staphylococcus haemolyticus]|uniref:phage tail domain-containing protein n=2 Tax=Staphylococcus TaxID=1279 RepID=UPI0027FD4CEA|nr:phage tail domain-containing protein [Staphylococcus haemolyticus]MDQ7229936.1 phage tail family protein [Staphylococcus haemolyticus]